MKIFKQKQCGISFPNLITKETKEGRYYITPEGNLYPSITTVLGRSKEKYITEWKNKIGEKEAEKIQERSKRKGTFLHEIIEKYLNNQLDPEKDLTDLHYKWAFESIIPYLDRIDNIVAQEKTLYSDHLCVAGRLDCFAYFDNIPSIIDFKTTSSFKDKSYIDSYFHQTTAYSIMIQEKYEILVPQIVIIMASWAGIPQLFVERRKNYIKPLLETMKKYNEKYNERMKRHDV